MKATRISVISDTHLLPERMVANNETFKKHLHIDRKLLAESEGLLDAALELIDKNNSDLLFMTGDITKDGEKISHQVFEGKMQEFISKKEGRRVFLIPGNHDLNNRKAFNYNLDGKGIAARTDTVTPVDFVDIYGEIIYKETISMYKDSEHFQRYLGEVNREYLRKNKYRDFAHGYCSYASRLDLREDYQGHSGLTVIGLDTVKCSIETVVEQEDGYQNTDGIITIDQLKWLADVCDMAAKRNDVVVVLAHHAFLPHFNNQEKTLAPYIIDNHRDIIEDEDPRLNGKTPADVLADCGVKFLFTGHMHAQDIAKKISPNGHTIYDIETGSTVTYPLPVRHMKLKNKVNSYDSRVELKIVTELISKFEYPSSDGDLIHVNEAINYASQNLITVDLLEGLVGEYVLPNLKLRSRDFVDLALNRDDKAKGLVDFLAKSYGKLLGSKDDPLYISDKKLSNIKLYYKEDTKLSNLVLNVNYLGLNYVYEVTKEDMQQFLDQLMDQIDEKLIENHRLIMGWVKKLSKEFLEVEFTQKGSIRTFSDLANEAYLIHLRGDERLNEDLEHVLESFSDKDLLSDALMSMKKTIVACLEDLLKEINYKDLIRRYLKRTSKNQKLIARIIDRRVYGFFGSNLADAINSIKMDKYDMYDAIIGLEGLSKKTEEWSKKLMSLVNDLSSEDQEEYKDYAYFEDNNTFIIEKLNKHRRNDQDLGEDTDRQKKSNLSKALMYADILTIGALLFVYMSKKNRR